MKVGELMAVIAAEAERQGFQVRQTRSTMWQFRRGTSNWFFAIKEPTDVLTVLGVLIANGLDWSIPD